MFSITISNLESRWPTDHRDFIETTLYKIMPDHRYSDILTVTPNIYLIYAWYSSTHIMVTHHDFSKTTLSSFDKITEDHQNFYKLTVLPNIPLDLQSD
jgi:hypothetical protein